MPPLRQASCDACRHISSTAALAHISPCTQNLRTSETALRIQWMNRCIQAVVRKCPKLLALGLRGTMATDATVATIAAQCPLLQALDLSLCPAITNSCALHLPPLQCLQVLHLPPAAALVHFAALAAQLPALRVFSGGGGTSQGGDAAQSHSPQHRQAASTAEGSCQTDLSVFPPHRIGGGSETTWMRTSCSPGAGDVFSAPSSILVRPLAISDEHVQRD